MSRSIYKIIRNESGETRRILNRDISHGESYDIPSGQWMKLYMDDSIRSYITSGDYIVNDGTTDLSAEAGLIHIDRFQPLDVENWREKRILTWQVHKTKNGNQRMSNASWFDAHPSRYSTGSYSGYNSNAMPFIIPCNCYIYKAIFIFRRAKYDWRCSTGNIFFEFGFYKLSYNSHTDYCRLGVELEGSFSGNDTGTDNFKYEITNFNERVGSNSFSTMDILGVQFRKDTSTPGQIYQIYDPIVLFEFKEI